MDTPVQPFDLGRMFLGDQPWLFYLEIVVRTLILYAYGLLLMRWLGSRTIGQLSTVEFLLVIALGSALGDPMFYPDVPVFHGMAVITVVVAANRVLDKLITRSPRVERLIEGRPQRVIENGVLSREFLAGSTLGRSETFQQLRGKGISQLGEVLHAYSEPDGVLTVFRASGTAPPGLPIVPPWEIEPPRRIAARAELAEEGPLACMRCGTRAEPDRGRAPASCPHCDGTEWTPAVAIQAPPSPGD